MILYDPREREDCRSNVEMTAFGFSHAGEGGMREPEEERHVMCYLPTPIRIERFDTSGEAVVGCTQQVGDFGFVAQVSLMIAKNKQERPLQQSGGAKAFDEAAEGVVEVMHSLQVVAEDVPPKRPGSRIRCASGRL